MNPKSYYYCYLFILLFYTPGSKDAWG